MLRSVVRGIGHHRRRASAAILLLVSATTVLPLATKAESNAQAQQIVAQADRIRFPHTGFQVDVKITSKSKQRGAETRGYRILSRGNDKTLVMTTAPASEKGQILLMRGSDLWVFLPDVSQPVRLPLSQRLTGQVANGDLARANFAGDYNATISGKEAISGQSFYVLDLTASKRGVTYHRVKYWVNAKNYWPYKAEFYTVSKRLLKVAYYQNYKDLGGQVRPTRLLIEDRRRKGDKSVLDYVGLVDRDLPNKFFTKQYLKKLKR